MKPRNISRYFGIQTVYSLALISAITAFADSARATTYVWNGATNSSWTTATNWTPSGAAPNNLTAGHRLTVSNAAANPLIYDATLGTTVYGATAVRALVVGSATSGAMSITGGTFSSAGSDILDVIGNGAGTGVLTISGGNYIGPSLGTSGNVGTSMGLGGTGVGTLNISSGSATLSILTFNGSTATVNLNGGTLALNNFVRLGGTSTINFNGGTLKPRASTTTFLPDLASTNVLVKSLGAIVDTDGFDVTIAEPLLTDTVSTGGGITKNGLGLLTLGAASTTTGPAIVNAGGLSIVAGANSWAPSTFTHSGNQLDINFGVYSSANGVPINTGALTLNSVVTVNVTGSNLPPFGQVKLLDYGTKSGSGSLVAGTLPANTTLAENTVDGYYYLDVSLAPGTAYTWSAASGDWDTVTANWNSNTAIYSEPALVTFPDLSGGRSINLTSDFSPISTTFSNEAGNDYDISGSAITGTGILVKNGAGTAIFSNPLSFTGGTYLNAGKIQLASRSLFSDSIAIESGATLSYDSISAVTQAPSSSAGQLMLGAGILEKKGTGTLTLGSGTGTLNWNFSPGAVIDVREGTVVCNTGSGSNSWTSNKASLNIESGATFDGFQHNVYVDALTGTGTYQGGNFGPRDLRIGVSNGSGTFSGTIKGKPGSAASCVSLYKLGSGTQTLDGPLDINTTTTFGGQRTLLVSGGTLNLSPTAGSVIGTTGSSNSGSVDISTGQFDVATLNQTSGTLAANTFGIGRQGKADYNISGGILNVTQIDLAFTGPTSGSGAVAVSISDTAEVNVRSNGGILMGQFFGRPVTVTQTGGNVVFYSDAGLTRGGTGSLQFKSSSLTPAYNLSGGTLSIPGITWTAAGGGSGGGNGTINFNGGILQVTNSAFSVPTGTTNGLPVISLKVLGDAITPDSGAIIDNYGLNINFAAGFLHAGSSTFDGGVKITTSVPGGSVTLSGINTYTGDTVIPSANSLVLADNAELRFVLDGMENNKITGTGAVTLNGDFTVDTTNATLVNATTWTLVDVTTLAETFSPTFTLVGFTEAGTTGIHTKVDGVYTWTFSEATGKLSLSGGAATGYAAWIGGFTVGDAAPGADPDNDGISNLLEYVLDGNPSISDTSKLPSVLVNSSDFVFSFNRRDDSELDTTQTFQYGTNLTGWTDVAIGASNFGPDVNGVVVAVGENATSPDAITVTVPKTLASGGKLFGRLKAVKP